MVTTSFGTSATRPMGRGVEQLPFREYSGAELLSSPAPIIDLSNLLLDLSLPSPCRRSIALAETFAASAISSLDEAGG